MLLEAYTGGRGGAAIMAAGMVEFSSARKALRMVVSRLVTTRVRGV